ncbi:9bfe5c77-07d6-4a65-91cb-700e6146b374 [Sclerotinia trifoliorum]|uniref:9bfe5c77-07d6-4a65-91cb-700e6146b374 n=1 Tax=Sclerotinia trifoliorum TaxID=28548 RepID=A0A8H2VRT3_9HELO|nr:9bfe5c77-07d6-4a65-91cb-700e6146b374 [Sclerotinia trifoliorum]
MNAGEFQDPLFSFPSLFDDNLASQQEFVPKYRGEFSLVDSFGRDVGRTISATDNLRTPLPPVSQSSLLLSRIDQTMNQSTPNHAPPIALPTNVAHKMPPTSDYMPSLPKPARRPALTGHSAEDWERQRATFTQLYIAEDKPLKEVMKLMEEKHRFRATPRQYKRRIEQWKLDKNIKENDMRVILRKDLKRKREGKKSEFKISGRDVEPQKIERFAQRNKTTEESILGFDIETPGYIACDTPAPTIVDEGMMHHTGGDIDMEDSTATSLETVDSGKKRQIPLSFTSENLSPLIKRVSNDPPAKAVDAHFNSSFLNRLYDLVNVSSRKYRQWESHRLVGLRNLISE